MSKLKGTILVVDDDQDVLYTAKLILKRKFDQVLLETNPEQLPKTLKKTPVDVVLLDMNFAHGRTSGNEGIYWLRETLKQHPDQHIIMNTAYGDIKVAVEAMKEGAIDFIVKPWEEEKLLSTVTNVFQLARSKNEVSRLQKRENALAHDLNAGLEDFIYGSKSMKSVMDTIEKVADTDANVLILGENGTGKELVARAIHNRSSQCSSALIKVDLGSLSEKLFESELFGHVKGAFTDARTDRSGRFEIAGNGSLFLDEVGNLPTELQTKLLSVLQNREFYKLGSNTPLPFNARLICATNANIQQMVSTGGFRQDLLYRINTVEIHIPPLRERVEDIIPIAEHYLDKYVSKYRKQGMKLEPSAVKKLQNHSWPGNVRELQHAIERVVILANDLSITASDFPVGNSPTAPASNTVNKNEVEKELILKAIKKHQGNLTKASEDMGIGRSTLYRKMKKYGLE